MKTDSRIRMLFVAAAVIITTSGCTNLADLTNSNSNSYKFEIAQGPMPHDGGWAVTVQLSNSSTGQRVANAEIFKVQTVPAPSPKIVPGFQEKLIPLISDGHGGYLYTSHDFRFGERLRLAARVQGESGVIHGTVQVNG
jgi:uncharacterized protein YceK